MSKINFGTLLDGMPLAFDVDQLAEKHFAIVGRIGQRKTLLLVSLLVQYIALLRHTVVYIDLGGDQAAYWIMREAAQAAGKPFYLVSLGAYDGCSWDPIRNTPPFLHQPQVAAAGISQGLRLEHGEGYGRTFWSRLSTSDINRALDSLTSAGAQLPSFEQLASELKRQGEKSKRQQVSEAYLAAEQLLRYSTLTEQRSQQLYLGQAIEESAVVYAYLPTAHFGGAARAVASLLGWCTTVEAADRVERGKEPCIVHLAIDEFPQVAAARSATDAILAMARKWGIQMYLVFQDMEQLKTADGDLGPIITSQCQRVIFTAETEREQQQLRFESEDMLRGYGGKSHRGLRTTTSEREVLEPRLTRNEILQCNGIAMQAFGVFKLGDEHRDPIRFNIMPPTSRETHSRLKRKPLPPLPSQGSMKPKTNTQAHSPRVVNDDVRKHRKAAAELLARIEAEERWRMKR